MSDNHVLEEIRSLRGAHAGLMSRMSDVCGELRELVAELRHTQKTFDEVNRQVSDLARQVHAMQLDNATNKPILDIAKSMNRNMWLTIFGAAGAVIGTNFEKFLG